MKNCLETVPFRCEKCDKSLDGVGYFEENNEIICAECYDQHFAIKCHKCGQSLHSSSVTGADAELTKTKIITCENKNFHVDCYKCKVRIMNMIFPVFNSLVKDCDSSLLDQHVFVREDDLICSSCRKD